jgi:hypothetical protein
VRKVSKDVLVDVVLPSKISEIVQLKRKETAPREVNPFLNVLIEDTVDDMVEMGGYEEYFKGGRNK